MPMERSQENSRKRLTNTTKHSIFYYEIILIRVYKYDDKQLKNLDLFFLNLILLESGFVYLKGGIRSKTAVAFL